nr:proline-rich receptor-like protein kinase PERK10 [Aegilops tauschii subsp. strangulata]
MPHRLALVHRRPDSLAGLLHLRRDVPVPPPRAPLPSPLLPLVSPPLLVSRSSLHRRAPPRPACPARAHARTSPRSVASLAAASSRAGARQRPPRPPLRPLVALTAALPRPRLPRPAPPAAPLRPPPRSCRARSLLHHTTTTPACLAAAPAVRARTTLPVHVASLLLCYGGPRLPNICSTRRSLPVARRPYLRRLPAAPGLTGAAPWPPSSFPGGCGRSLRWPPAHRQYRPWPGQLA